MRLALTKRTGDAIRMLMCLIDSPADERWTSDRLARAAGVSHGNAPTLVAALSRAGLLDCTRGPGGGCRLSRDASEITIGEAIVAIEGTLEPEHCAIDERRCVDRDFACGIHASWRAMVEQLQGHLAGLSLREAADRHEANRIAFDGIDVG